MLPNCADQTVSMHTPKKQEAGPLTFSKPKNLSLPSPRNGGALASSFSSGVGSGALGSFLTGVVPAAGLEGVPDLRRPKKDMLRCWRCGGKSGRASMGPQVAARAVHVKRSLRGAGCNGRAGAVAEGLGSMGAGD